MVGSPDPKPTILVFELRMMGDAVMSLPFIRAAMTHYHVVVCCTLARREVYETILPPTQVIAWEPPWIVEDGKYALARWRAASWRKLIRELRAVRAEVTLTVWPDSRVHLLMALSGARQRLGLPMNEKNYYGHHRPERRKQMKFGNFIGAIAGLLMLRPLLNHKIDRLQYYQHHVKNWQQLAEALSLPWDESTPWVPRESFQSCLPEEARLANPQGRKTWAWHLGARSPIRRWPPHKIESVVRDYFVAEGRPLLLIASHDDDVPSSLAALVPVVRPRSFRELCAVVDAVDYLVCNDTGVSHVGAALGKRVVSIFSAGEPRLIAPYANADLVVENNVCSYRPCYDRCVMPSFICLEAVGPDLVTGKLRLLEDV